MMAAARGNFVRAAALNPLMFLGLVALLAWFGVWAVERMTGHRLPATTGQQLRRVRWGWVIAAAIITNWIYLWLTLP
jgi:hypothetical protein